MYKNRWPINENLERYDANVRYAGTIYGDLAVMLGQPEYREIRAVRFVTDEAGFRNEPGARSQRNRLILLGDSFGAGSGGTQESMLSSILNTRYQVTNYNLSMGGASPWQEFVTLKQEFSNINLAPGAGILWLLFSGNDLEDLKSANFDVRHNGFFKRTAIMLTTLYHRSPIRQLLQTRKDRRHLVAVERSGRVPLLFFVPYLERVGRTKAQVIAHPGYLRLHDAVEAMTAFCDSHRLRLYIVLIPSKEEVYSWVADSPSRAVEPMAMSGLAQVLQEWAKAKEIPFLDLGPDFEQAAQRELRANARLLYWRDDTHWNEAGQQLAAQLICERMLCSP